MARKEREKSAAMFEQAVNNGIDEILKHHPVFKNNRAYIAGHIDSRRFNAKIKEIYADTLNKGWSQQKRGEHLLRELSDYVASGRAFDEEGQEIILRKSLKEKAETGLLKSLFSGNLAERIFARKALKGEQYLNKTIGAWQELYHLFQEGGYAKRMPEIYNAVERVYDLGILDPALDILKHSGLIDQRKYRELKASVHEEIKETSKKVVGGLEAYVTPQKQAAAVFLVLGFILVLFSGLKFTGAAIFQSVKPAGSVLGLLFMIVALILSFRTVRKN